MSLQIETKQTYTVNGKSFATEAEAQAYIALQGFEAEAKAFVAANGFVETTEVEGKSRANPHFNTAVKAVALYMASQAAE
jgi:hypothetical protein